MAKKRSHDEATAPHDEAPTEDSSPVVESGYQTITINKRLFRVKAPYAEGHICNVHEAGALNQTMAENIRNNFATMMKTAAEKEGRTLEQTDLDAYMETYTFGARRSRTGVVLDPVDVEEKKLAEIAVREAYKKHGTTVKAVGQEKFQAHVAMAIGEGRYRAQAERIVAERQSSVGLELDLDLAA